MNLFELSAKISVDDSGFKKSMENAQKVSKNVAAAMKNLQSPLDKAKSRFEAIKHPVETAKANFEKLKNSVEKARHPIENFKNKVAEASAALETKRNKLSTLAAGYDSAKKKVDDLTKEFNKSAKESGTSSQKTQELAKKLNEAEKEAEEAKKELDDYAASVSKAGKKSDSASNGIGKFASKLGSGLKTTAKIGTAAVAAVGSGIAALGTYAAKVGGDFEAQMSKVSAISGATGDDLQALEDKAKQLGIDTKFSATEAGQAFEYMAMAGWKTEQMLDGVAGIMDLAAASGEDLASVSDIVTDAMTAFGLSADQSTHFADVLAKASSNANTNVGLMGETFKYVAPVAGAMGFSIEDTATAIGLMANAGIKGSQAGTALRAMFSRLAKPTDEVAMAMETLNLSITNSDGSMRELDEIMEDLRKGFDGLTEAQQTEMAAQLAGQEAMSGLLAIVNTSEAEFNKLSTAIYSADGAAKQMADTMANNLQGKFTLLKSSAEGFGLALYDKIQQPLTDMVSWAVDGLNQLTKAFNENGVDGLVEAAGNILSEAINEIVNGLPKIVDLAIRVIDSFISGLNKNLDTIVSGAVSVVVTLANGILNMLPKIVQLGLDLIVSLANGISQNLGALIPTIIDVVLQIVETLTNPETLTNILDAAMVLIENLAYGLMDAIPQLVQAALLIIENLVAFLLDPANLAKLLKMAFDLIVGIGTGLINAIPELLKSVTRIITGIIALFKDADWGKIGKDLVDGFKNGIARAWTSLKSWFRGLFGDLIGIAKKILGIASPSKEFKKIGGFTAEGFGAGFEDEFAKVKDDMEDALNFDDASVGINASIRKVGAGAAGMAYGGSSFGDVHINIDGARYDDPQSLAVAVAEELQNMTDRRLAVYA